MSRSSSRCSMLANWLRQRESAPGHSQTRILDCCSQLSLSLGGQAASESCAHKLCFGRYANAREIETIGIPARSDRGIITQPAVRVPPAGVLQQIKMRITQIEEDAPQARSVFRFALAMLIVCAVILAPRIVKHGKEAHHFNNGSVADGDLECVLLDPSPMSWPVNRVTTALKLSGHVIPKGIKIDLNNLSHKPCSS